MEFLVVGATGATGRLIVKELLDRNHKVRVIVRSAEKMPDAIRVNEKLRITEANILEMGQSKIDELVKDCDVVISCLGHNATMKGVFRPPYRLVRDATQMLCNGMVNNSPLKKIPFILMNTVGNLNKDNSERFQLLDGIVVGLIRLLVPPQRDNEEAAEFLRHKVGQNHSHIEWTAVRPDTLTNENESSAYDVLPSPTQSIFGKAETSRINVAHFMVELATNKELWEKWKGKMPVIYNSVK